MLDLIARAMVLVRCSVRAAGDDAQWFVLGALQCTYVYLCKGRSPRHAAVV